MKGVVICPVSFLNVVMALIFLSSNGKLFVQTRILNLISKVLNMKSQVFNFPIVHCSSPFLEAFEMTESCVSENWNSLPSVSWVA